MLNRNAKLKYEILQQQLFFIGSGTFKSGCD